MVVHVALLRGINLGPARRIPMAQLRALLSAAGYANVRTHLQSGNVVLESASTPDALAAELEAQLASAFGFEVPVVVRSRAELADVIARDPFGALADDPRRYQVTFLTSAPPPGLEATLAAAAVAPERVVLSGREIYAWHPNGIARSELAKLLADRRAGVGGTARNWNTVTALLTLTTA